MDCLGGFEWSEILSVVCDGMICTRTYSIQCIGEINKLLLLMANSKDSFAILKNMKDLRELEV